MLNMFVYAYLSSVYSLLVGVCSGLLSIFKLGCSFYYCFKHSFIFCTRVVYHLCIFISIFPISSVVSTAWFCIAPWFLGTHSWYYHRTDCTARPWVHKTKNFWPGGREKRPRDSLPQRQTWIIGLRKSMHIFSVFVF